MFDSIKSKSFWRPTIMAIFLVALFLKLSLWQVSRAHTKEQILESFNTESKKHAQPLFGLTEKVKQYQRVMVQGRYLKGKELLLDNRIYKHKFGFNVLSPMIFANKKVLLIDRGWVAQGKSRKDLPSIKYIKGLKLIKGQVYYPSKNTLSLGSVVDNPGHSPLVIEKIDTKLISNILGLDILPFVLRVDKSGSENFIRNWKVINSSPNRHYGYALQWFLFALITIVIFISLIRKKNV